MKTPAFGGAPAPGLRAAEPPVPVSKATAAGEVWQRPAGCCCQEKPARAWWYAVRVELRQTRRLQQKNPKSLLPAPDNLRLRPRRGSGPAGHPRATLFSLGGFLCRVLAASEGRLLAPGHAGFAGRRRNGYIKFPEVKEQKHAAVMGGFAGGVQQ